MRYQCFEGPTFTILVREFNGQTLEMGPTYEAQFSKHILCSELARFLHESMF